MRELPKILAFLLRTSRSIRFHRALFALAVVVSVISGGANAAVLAVVNAAIYAELGERRQLVIVFVALALVIPVLRFVSGLVLTRLVQLSRVGVELELSRRILAAPLRRLEEVGRHRLLAVLTQDVGSVVAVLSGFPIVLRQATLVAGCMAYMAMLSWRLFFAVVVFIVIGLLIYRLPMRLGRQRFATSRELADEVFRHFRGLTEGIKELKIHRRRRTAFLDDQLTPAIEGRAHHQIRAAVVFLAAASWRLLLAYAILGMLVFALPLVWSVDRETVSGYTLAFLFLQAPLSMLLNQLSGLAAVAVSIDKIEELGLSLEAAAEPPPISEADEAAAGRDWRRLALDGVTHTYFKENEEHRFVMGPIDLVLERGTCLFLVGGNGSGKTTLAKLLIGLYAPEAGTVSLDGEAVGDRQREAYRQLFSVVFNDFHLFDALLGLGRAELDSQARDYLETLQLSSKVTIRDGQLSQLNLSQGQRKRLALLTAYLEDRSIYVFDEWAADQDPVFKETFYHRLLADLKARGKTVVVISHDDRYYHLADRIVKLDDGRVVFDRRRDEIPDDVGAYAFGLRGGA